ncbi:MAG: M48 family metallopeptidase [Candidatus Krumholzibacteriia bacterium]
MKTFGTTIRTVLVILALAALAAGCASVAKMATQVGQGTGAITEDQAQSLNRSIDAVEKTFTDITPEQEYYLGRAVAANLLTDQRALDDAAANAYLNRLGQTLAMASDRPETFGGYHFLLLDSDEINAFAAPGGLILVTRGMVRLCGTEDELAAVLAHEIGHIQGKHGLRAIKNSRLTGALTVLAAEGARQFGGQDLKNLVEAYEGSISDITGTLVTSGYSRGLEQEADRAAVAILERVGYDPHALVTMLTRMKERLEPGGLDFAKTHPDPGDRIADIKPLMTRAPAAAEPAARHRRFIGAVGGLLAGS